MRVDVYSRHDAYLGTIAGDALLAFEHSDELNGEDSVSIATTFRLREGYRLVWRDADGRCHEHVCQDPKGLHDDAGMIYTDTALNSICELFGDYIEDKRPHGYSFSRALSVALEPTRWEAGTVDVPGTVSHSLTFYHISAREALQSILECGGELETTITVGSSGVTRRQVGIRAHRGATSGHKRFAYGKDATSVSKTEHWNAITACYGYGKGEETDAGGYGRKLTFGSINGGINYVQDNDALQAYGRPDGDGGLANVFGIYENSECEDAAQLKQETIDYLEQHSVPGVTYEADVVDLVAFGREWEGVAVGDEVQMVDAEFSPELRCEGRVTKLVKDLLGGTQTVTLGNVTETLADTLAQQKKELSSLNRRSDSWDIAATTPLAYLQQIIDGLNEQFNIAGMSYKFTSFEQGDIWSSVPLDADGKPTVTGGYAIQICSQGFRIANGTNADGTYNWRTFGTGAGFVADFITTGTLLANLIKAGQLLVGDEDDPVLLADFDAKTVELKGSSVIIGSSNAADAIAGLEEGVSASMAVYGYCTTAASTRAKSVAIEGFELREGAIVNVMFTHENTASSPTLNVSGTGAKDITLGGALLTAENHWHDYDLVTFAYVNGGWAMVDSGSHALIEVTKDAINLEVQSAKNEIGDAQSKLTRYGTCTTAAATAEKSATVSGDLTLVAGLMVSVAFTYANTASYPRLNVNDTGAKYIYVGNSYMTSDYYWRAGTTVTFVYTGSSWRVCDSGSLARISVAEDEIELKVSKGSVSSQISVESGQVTIESNRFSWDSTYSSMTRYGVLTAQSVTARGTFRCGYDSDYLQMNSAGQLAGYRNGSQIGYVDYSAAMKWLPTGETKYGMQLYGKEHVRMSTPILSTAASSSTSTTTTSGSTGRIWLAGFTSDPGSWKLEDLVLMEFRFINGICTRSMNA